MNNSGVQPKADVIIIGAGIIGLSIAYHLLEREPQCSIIVLEKEKLLGLGSTGTCTGGIRYQFTSPLLRKLSLQSRDFFLNFETVFDAPCWYRERGYLMLASQEFLWKELRQATEQAKDEGIPINLLLQEDLEKNFPYLQRERYLGGTFGQWDAYADPYAVLAALYASVRRKGVRVNFEQEVTKIITRDEDVIGVETTKGTLWSPIVVNASGPYAAKVAASAGIMLPVHPFLRQVYVCTNPKDVPPAAPLIVDLTSGFYLHQEASGKTILLGGTDKDTRPGIDETIDKSLAEEFFMAAMETIPSALNIKWLRTYTGIREQTSDFHPILGEVSELKGFFVVSGLSGHGFMHAPAIGSIMAELIIKGGSERIESSLLFPQRFSRSHLSEALEF
ncbi:glycine/D-amino acid oxidase, deaminating [Desulfosporosinus acidiphilus SJ4]|uniref:Glycine/D-amino acid oxidase, deaminating n=1 Tax=Desulfosporosinus acidiphilus (strain DSM 22704 / JCM 16185 / SJ4) TaxID=646529 RepID=I4D509_DESAJ|nr:FAD-binding oxidoreductase [Desulfosporosinus acidiphilus]AFM40883.1 glycine/D-amino acid oxidase, deaminating [Desulfosporosinus acidiphilus SJ4]